MPRSAASTLLARTLTLTLTPTLALTLPANLTLTLAQERTPLHIAVRARFHEVARALVDGGADPTLVCKGTSTLHQAAAQGDSQMVALLLDAASTASGASPAVPPLNYINGSGKHGWSALGLAARAGNADSVKALLGVGADRAAVMQGGKTALEIARLNRKAAIVRLLEL